MLKSSTKNCRSYKEEIMSQVLKTGQGVKYSHPQTINIDGKSIEYTFVYTEQKLIKFMRVIRQHLNVMDIRELPKVFEENPAMSIFLFDLMVEVLIGDEELQKTLQDGLDMEGMSSFFKVASNGFTKLTNKLQQKNKNTVQSDGHPSTKQPHNKR